MVSISEFNALMAEYDLLTVHCAGFVKGTGNEQTDALSVLERLQFCVSHNLDIEVSCSVIGPGDDWVIDGRRNYFGPIGLILGPHTDESVRAAWCADAGTSPNDHVGQGMRFVPPNRMANDVNSVLDAYRLREDEAHNEVTLNRYKVFGLFVHRVVHLLVDGKPTHIPYPKIHEAFPSLPVFLLQKGRLTSLTWNFEKQGYDVGNNITSRMLYLKAPMTPSAQA